ncbi:MAG: putative hydro-lyase [Lachnospiraceae bacterium]|nr:putative hydro-lyase [Lachnospiraceae bacterium]
MTPSEARMKIRKGEITTQTSGMCNGYAQANLCILPKKYAYDFLLFASRNQTSCPILEVLDEGSRYTRYMADHADIATDIPKYRIYRNGVLTEEVTDISAYWQDDFVSFLIGCSFSFEGELLDAEVPIRHIEQGRNVPMFLTNIPCEPAGIFHGNMVVSMRPIPYGQVVRAVTATAAMPKVHGAPVHIGDPALIGIADITKPDFGDSVEIHAGDVPVFWPCGVTPQAAIMAAKPELAITHAPGHMFLTDVRNSVLKS